MTTNWKPPVPYAVRCRWNSLLTWRFGMSAQEWWSRPRKRRRKIR
jgi:hypothetical protein